eukprot:34053_1
MSTMIQKARGFKVSALYYRSTRSLTDRSFRLANALDIKAGQQFKTQISVGNYHPFMHTSELKREPDLSRQILIDIRSNEDYNEGHIKDAVCLPRTRFDFTEYVDTKGGITFDEVYNTMRQVGVSNGTDEIILYDNAGEMMCRAFWVLRYFGFANIRILSGGYLNGWRAIGLPEDTKETVVKESTELTLKPSRPYLMTRPTQMMENHQAGRSQIIDTRRPEEYAINKIPRSINIPSYKFMKDGSFKSVQEIRQLCRSEGFDVENNSKGHIILYSNRGRGAAIGYFALSMVGFDRLAIYDQGIENWMINQDKKLSVEQTDAFQK